MPPVLEILNFVLEGVIEVPKELPGIVTEAVCLWLPLSAIVNASDSLIWPAPSIATL